MTRARGAGALLACAMTLGVFADRTPPRETITLAGYRVLAADFHVHDSMWSDATVTPFGLVIEARHQGLDALAVTGHRQTHDAKWARWFSELIDGPTVLIGEEMPEVAHHVVAVGIQSTIDSALPVVEQIAEIHRQGGVAIAAHPLVSFWPGFSGVESTLDGSEICHPILSGHPEVEVEFAEFARKVDGAAIGSSDFHGSGRLGQCRTFVFTTVAGASGDTRATTAAAIVDAIRDKRTVVYTPSGRVYGDPDLVRLAEADGRLRAEALAPPSVSALDWAGRLLGVLGLMMLVVAIR